MLVTVQMTFRPEVYLKFQSWVNRCGGDRAFASRIHEAPRTVRLLVYSTPRLMERFGFSPPVFENHGSDI